MPLALALAKLAHGRKALSQGTQLSQRQIPSRRESLFISLPRRGQLRRTKPCSRLRMQPTHPQLFGPRVAHIKILRHPAKTCRRSQQRPVGRRVKGAPKKLAIHEAFQRHQGMPVLGLPIRRELVQAKLHGASAQIGIPGAVGQNHKPAVLRQKMQTAAALLLRPAQPLIPRPQVPCRRAPPQQGHPLALVTHRITTLFPH